MSISIVRKKEKIHEKEFDRRAPKNGEIPKTTFELIPKLRESLVFNKTHYVFVEEIKTKFEGSTHF